ncbi:hypothetical protein BH23ACT5_BH23ACT5_07980 [soil metagenome]
MNLKTIGWARAIQGLRDGNQSLLVSGLALLLIQRLRSSRPKRELIYRKTIPLGSTIVVRHTAGGQTKLDIHKPPRTRD